MIKLNYRPSKRLQKIIFAIIIFAIVGAIALYFYSRTYAKSQKVGLPMTAQAFKSISERIVGTLVGMSVSAFIIAFVSLAFQTTTGSRILTPSMIGFDSIFIGTQTVIVFFLGTSTKIFSNVYLNFAITAGAMLIVSMLMYGAVLRNTKNNIVFLLLFGLILSGIIRSGSTYLQTLMDPTKFNQLQAATAVSINSMNAKLAIFLSPFMIVICSIFLIRHRSYNILALGEDNAKNLGLNYLKETNFNLVMISLGMSIATALIGSLTFLGLLAVNITREIFKTNKHFILFLASALIATFALVFGQALTELTEGSVPVTVIIDAIGCSYMFYLILKENKKL
ncbi:MAG: iron chelate uptake ABC transporter family permease subunit [Christensenellaceae bacterium]|jgi:iron complex transport system permease protein|nr:iron chelate uptake ABC transporter family permease subunit [Christensenellaceae bacterium]